MSKTTALASSSSSAVQTHLKNNTFLPSFICCSGLCSYFWVVLVADWNLLPLFPHSFVSEGIRDVYGSGWILWGQLYTIDPSWWLKPSWAPRHFSTLVISFAVANSYHVLPPLTTNDPTKVKIWMWRIGAGCYSLFPQNVSLPVKEIPWTRSWKCDVHYPIGRESTYWTQGYF